MKKMFWGLLFLFFDINLGRLCVTPAWMGYLLIWSGLGEVPESQVFQNTRGLAVGAAEADVCYLHQCAFRGDRAAPRGDLPSDAHHLPYGEGRPGAGGGL